MSSVGSMIACLAGLLAVALGTAADEAAAQQPRLSIAEEIRLVDGQPHPFDVTVLPANTAPSGSWITILTLGAPLSFSSGAPYDDKIWKLSPSELAGVTVTAQLGPQREWAVVVGLLDAAGAVLASATTFVVVEPAPRAQPAARIAETPAFAPQPRPSEAVETESREPIGAGGERRSPEARPASGQDRDQGQHRGQGEASDQLALAARLFARGEQQLAQGNIAVAREFFKRAADEGLPEAALMMGDTFDAEELTRRGAVGIRPDPAQAKRWYEKARELGAITAATQRLMRLSAR